MFLSKLRTNARHRIVLAGLVLLMGLVWAPAVEAKVPGAPAATVGAVEGEARVFAESQEQPVILAPGINVDAWNTISTSTRTRLLLNWNNGLMTSVGDMSSLFVSVENRPDMNLAQFQVIEGIVRVATREGNGAEAPYAVLTPAAAMQPENYGDPTDIIVESYDPSTTAVTVLAGRVRVSTGGEAGATEKTLSACETAYVDQSKKTIDVQKISAEDVAQLVAASTLPGTIGMHPGGCMMASAPPPPVASVSYPRDNYYYIEDSEPVDFGIYDDITVLPPRAGVGCSILVPGIGQFTVPYAVLGNWACDPTVVLPFARRVFFDRCLVRYQDYWQDIWWRRNELHRIMYLAQLGGNTSLLWQARHELDYLNVRMRWADRRIHGLEGRMASLEQQEQRVRGRLPQGLNLHQAIADGLLAPSNVRSFERFQKKLRNDMEVQTRLANVAGQEIVQMRSRIGHERDAQKRMALRNGLVGFNRDVAEGKLPIPTQRKELSQLYGQMGKERDPDRQERLEGRLLDQLKKAQTGQVPNVLDPAKLTSLQKDLARFPNPEKRGDLEKRLTEIQHTVAARKEAEERHVNADELAAQAAREKNPQKQQELLGRLKDLSVPLALGGLGAVGVQQLRQQRQNVQQQISGETDQAKKATLQRTLDSLQQRETGLQQLERYRKGSVQGLVPGKEQGRQPSQQLQHRQPELQQQQPQEQRQLLQPRGPEQLRRGNQLDRVKPQEQLHLQQQKDRETDLQRRQQEDRTKKDAEPRRQQFQQERAPQQDLQKQQENLRMQQLQKEQENKRQQQLQQQERSRQEQMRKDEEKAKQQLRQQQDKEQREQLRLQQERSRQQQMKQQQERSQQQLLKQQQEKSRQEQLRQQQERGRQEQLRLQQERSRQQQMRLQQEKSQQQQLRQQQERSRQLQLQQQERSRQDAMRRQQEQARQQSLRQQQERARQNQLNLQKPKDDDERRRR